MGSSTAEKQLKYQISKHMEGNYPNNLLMKIHQYFILTNYQRRLHNQLNKLHNTINTSSSEDTPKLKLEYNKIAKKLIENLKKMQLHIKENK